MSPAKTKGKSRKGLPVFEAELAGLQAIEASAGTGKTWTICGLYLRLLLEKDANVSDILAITFTKAATAELRDRIRTRLHETQLALEALENGGPEPEDAFIRGVLERIDDRARARVRIVSALCGFDEAPIQTIHGFCQRALADHAFSSRVAFDCTLQPDIGDVVHEVAADFWRREIAPCAAVGDDPVARRLLFGWLQTQDLSVAGLEDWVQRYVRREGLDVRRPAVARIDRAMGAFVAAFDEARALWAKKGSEVEKLLCETKLLKRTTYKAGSIPAWCAELGEWFQAGHDLKLYAKIERFSNPFIAKHAPGAPPTHRFFDACDALIEARAAAVAALEAFRKNLLLDFLDFARREIARRFAERNAQSYDDLLLKLHRALTDDPSGSLAGALRRRYPYALIDEFQDTDPLQWGIFASIYERAPVDRHAAFLVGDPKQAIYSFRGADVYAYLHAVGQCGEPLRLLENQRSVEGLVSALNTLFATNASPFQLKSIRYEDVTASGRPKAPLIEGGKRNADREPLRIAWLGPNDKGKPQSKGAATEWAIAELAREVRRLIDGGASGEILLGAQPLEAGHIAVLVNTNRQANAVRDGLAGAGIASAVLSTQSVFHSDEAEQLERVLLAATSPKDAGAVRAALATDLVGLSAQQIEALADDASWEAVLSEFNDYHETWRAYGLMRMLRELFRRRAVPENLAQYRNGERRLTNLYHLSELLHLESAHLAGMDAVVAWLAVRRTEPATEEVQLRLESDAHLVQIVTIHKSKGLEYPITFVPFLWDGSLRMGEDGMVLHHDPERPQALVLDAGSKDYDAGLAAARAEEFAERLRVAYVALTRAKNRCYVFDGAIGGLEHSALGWLIHGIDGSKEDAGVPSPDELAQQVKKLVESTKGQARLMEAEATVSGSFGFVPQKRELQARTPLRVVPDGFALTSFSALQSALERQEVEPVPDHDAVSVGASSSTEGAGSGGQRFAFARGSDAGSCLHAIFERLDFAGTDADWTRVIREQLVRAGYGPGATADVQAWLREVVQVRLPGLGAGSAPFTLAEVARSSQMREMPFHLAFEGFSPKSIVKLARQHGIDVPDLPASRIRGYLSGYIDLAFRHDGRWYVADYKSNWLGATGEAYGPAGVAAGMTEGDYHLQYLLYVTAVHRWLRGAVAGYDYEKHFGGVLYLFLRGMHPEWQDEQGAPLGVFASRPPRALIEALDDGLGRRTVGIGEAA